MSLNKLFFAKSLPIIRLANACCLLENKNGIRWIKVDELKVGNKGHSSKCDLYQAGSTKIAETLTNDETHNVYVVNNGIGMG
jgi:hypothetical protein